jgi:signal peptidase I
MIVILIIHKVFLKIEKNIVFKDFEITKGDTMEFEKCRLSRNTNKIQREILLQTLEINCFLLLRIDLNQLALLIRLIRISLNHKYAHSMNSY